MPIAIKRIEDDEHFEYKGDVTVSGGIGKNATVVIKDGSLFVNGDVGERSDVSLVTTQQSAVVISGFSFHGSSVSIGSAEHTLQITGNLGSHAKIKTQSTDINIEGDIGANARLNTKSGDINAANVDTNATLNTMSGDIHVANVAESATLKTMSGDIHAGDVGADASLSTMSGDVKVARAHPSVSIETMSGDIYEGGVKRRKAAAHGSSVSIGGTSFGGGVSISVMSFIGGGGARRIIVDGRDITDAVRSSAASSAPVDEQPVRYAKK